MTIKNRCNICLEENCGGKYNCNCSACSRINECVRVLRPTIRITTKCTQSCWHCCFNCSPEKSDMMTLETAVTINKFCVSNDINILNVMGGEFFLNPDWYNILDVLSKDMSRVRLVSNGDWAASAEITQLVVDFMKSHTNVYLSISKDRWHTNKYVDKVMEICEENDIPCNIATEDQTTESSIVPIGRGQLEGAGGFYSMFACYCQKPDNKYTFLIDEKGEIYKCAFGQINYWDVFKSLEGGFDKAFKTFNRRFYEIFVGSCASCIRGYKNVSYKEKLFKILSEE